jgi:hypothetical protein
VAYQPTAYFHNRIDWRGQKSANSSMSTFNDDNNVDAPETNKLVKLFLLNVVGDVAFKLLIDNVELVDILYDNSINHMMY